MNEMNPNYFVPVEKKKRSVGRKIAWIVMVLAVIAVCVIIVIPVFVSEQHPPRGGGACKDNLRTIDGAIMQYRAGSDAYCLYTSGYVPELLREWPACPTDDRPYVIIVDGPGEPPRAYCPNGHTY